MCCEHTSAYCASHNIRDARVDERVHVGPVQADIRRIPGFFAGEERVHVGNGQKLILRGLSEDTQRAYGITGKDQPVRFVTGEKNDWIKFSNGVKITLDELGYGISADVVETVKATRQRRVRELVGAGSALVVLVVVLSMV